jgi:hypothetical protein
MKCLYFTICAQNYLAYALSLRASVLAVHPGADFRIVLADELAPAVRARVGDATIIEAKALEIPTFFDMAFRYSLMELNTAIKPPCFQHFFAATNVGAVVYFDPDIWLLRPLEHVHALLDAGKDVVVTPHITEPLDDGGFPDDQRHLQTGVYNLGFCAFRRSEQTFAFLDWWANKMLRGCRVDLESGIFVDQKYMDMLTCFIDEVGVLRHPGYNVAYWNLPHRAVRHRQGLAEQGRAALFLSLQRDRAGTARGLLQASGPLRVYRRHRRSEGAGAAISRSPAPP